jgi:tetratricopeptide (TPR) repeat protein
MGGYGSPKGLALSWIVEGGKWTPLPYDGLRAVLDESGSENDAMSGALQAEGYTVVGASVFGEAGKLPLTILHRGEGNGGAGMAAVYPYLMMFQMGDAVYHLYITDLPSLITEMARLVPMSEGAQRSSLSEAIGRAIGGGLGGMFGGNDDEADEDDPASMEPGELLHRAQHALNHGDPQGALAYLDHMDRHSETNEQWALVWAARGAAHMAANAYHKAAAAWRQAVERYRLVVAGEPGTYDEHFPLALSQYGQALMQLSRHDEAESVLNEALAYCRRFRPEGSRKKIAAEELAYVLHLLGHLYTDRFRAATANTSYLDLAEGYHQEALNMCKSARLHLDHHLRQCSQNGLAEVAKLRQGDFSGGSRSYHEATTA